MPEIRGLVRSRFARHTATVATGTIIGNGVAAALSPVISRVFSPSDIGQFGVYMSFIGVASVATTLRYEMAVVAADTDGQARQLAVGSLFLAVPMSATLGGLLYFLIAERLLGFGILPRIAASIAPFSLLVTAGFLVLRQLLVRGEQFQSVSRALIWQGVTRGVSQVTCGALSLGWLGLALGDFAGRLSAIGALYKRAINWRTHLGDVNWRSMYQTFRAYSEYATVAFPSALLNTVAINLSLPLVVRFFGAEAGGQFALVQLVFALPLTLLGTGMGDVFYSRISAYARDDKTLIKDFFLRTTRILLLSGAIPFVLLAAFAPTLLPWVFGKRWQSAGVMAALMAPWGLSQVVVSPVSRIVFAVQGQRLKLFYDAASVIVVVLSVGVSGRAGLSIFITIACLSLGQVATYVLYYFLILRAIDQYARASNGS